MNAELQSILDEIETILSTDSKKYRVVWQRAQQVVEGFSQVDSELAEDATTRINAAAAASILYMDEEEGQVALSNRIKEAMKLARYSIGNRYN